MSKLQSLIASLASSIKNRGPVARKVKYPRLLLAALEDLEQMIGNEEIKEDIASMASYFIANIGNKEVLLNSCLYGPPGVGKTEMAKKIAHILYAIGFIHGGAEEKSSMTDKFTSSLGSGDDLQLWISVLSILVYSGFTYLLTFVAFLYKKVGLWYFVLMLGAFLLLIAFIYWVYTSSVWAEAGSPQEREQTPESERRLNRGTEPSLGDLSDILTVCSREHFVGEYVGWTDKKTLKLLKENTGKVLVIDEAYSLFQDPRDTFGAEALNALNRYLSENPNKLVVIFAGYEEMMKKSIFAQQPGLTSRCIFHFRIPGYDAQQLFAIFQSKLRTSYERLRLAEPEKARKLFEEYLGAFPYYGRDCQRLMFYCQLEYNNDNIEQDYTPDQLLTTDQLLRALKKLEANNSDSQSSQPPAWDDSQLQSLKSLLPIA